MNDREVNIDENCYSLTVKQVLLCDDNGEGIDEIVILRPSNRFFSVTITEKELMKIVILSQSNRFFSVVVTREELKKTVILRQLNRHYDQKLLYGITTVFFMFKVFSCTPVNGLINGQN